MQYTNLPRKHCSRAGFTVVELLIVIVIIAILAAITVVAYNGIRTRAAESVVANDLTNASKQMEIIKVRTGKYPVTLPETVKASRDVELTLANSSYPVYANLSSVQQGVLFQTVCAQLISEGYGRGTNMGGQTEQYVTGCNVYGYGAMQINGWQANSFSVPISATTVSGWYNSKTDSDSWRPNRKADVLKFSTELESRFQQMGGSFPVTTFWDPWAAANNGGVFKEELPEPSGSTGEKNYCLQAVYKGSTSFTWHVNSGGKVATGGC